MIVFASTSYGEIEKTLLVPRYRDILVDQNNPIVHLKNYMIKIDSENFMKRLMNY